MKNIANIDFSDFYFNGHYASEYGVYVMGEKGLSPFSLLPSKTVKSEGVVGRDGAIVYVAYYDPRTFTVPLYISDITKIRDIAGWLSVKTPTDFYFKGDSVKIKVMVDGSLDLQPYSWNGTVEVKFIAYDPYFYAINDTKYTLTTFTNQTIFNDGNVPSNPLFKLVGTGNITVTVNGASFTVNNVTDYVYVDCTYCTVYRDSVTNKIADFSGIFPQLANGNNTISATSTGTLTQIEIQCNSRWI